MRQTGNISDEYNLTLRRTDQTRADLTRGGDFERVLGAFPALYVPVQHAGPTQRYG